MPELFHHKTPEEEARLQADGSVVLGEEYGYVRPLKLTCGFFEDLDRHDLFTLWRPEEAEVRMVHGELDETIPVEEARRFAVRFQIPLTVIPGEDHRLSIPARRSWCWSGPPPSSWAGADPVRASSPRLCRAGPGHRI